MIGIAVLMLTTVSTGLPIEFPSSSDGDQQQQHIIASVINQAPAAGAVDQHQDRGELLSAAAKDGGVGGEEEELEQSQVKPRTFGLFGAELGLLAAAAYGNNGYGYGYPAAAGYGAAGLYPG